MLTSQQFNQKNSLYLILFNFIITNDIDFKKNQETDLSKKEVKRYIEKDGVLVNSKLVYNPTFKIENNDLVQIRKKGIEFKCEKSADFEDDQINKINEPNPHAESLEVTFKESIVDNFDESVDVETINNYLLEYFVDNLECNSVAEVLSHNYKKAFAHIIYLLETKGFEEIKNSKYSYEITNFLKEKVIHSGLVKELQLSKSQINFSGKLIEILIDSKVAIEEESYQLVNNLNLELFQNNYYKFLQEYGKIVSTLIFQYTIQPFLNPLVCSRIAIENLIKPVHESISLEDSIKKYSFFEQNKDIYENYIQIAELDEKRYSKIHFKDIASFLFKILKQNCEANEEKIANITTEATTRKYNFLNKGRDSQDLFLYFNNIGEGLASNVKITSRSPYFNFPSETIGLIKPGEGREVVIFSKINYIESFKPELKIYVEWEEMSGKQKENEFIIGFELQEGNIPWNDLRKQKPYSISEIEDERKLYGRADILEELKSNILSNNIESYKLWGQKRVGKSSIVKTLKSILKDEEKVLVVYKAVGGLRNALDPVITLNDMGESLCSELLEEIDLKIKDPSIRERLRGIAVPTFNGSFNPLETFIKNLSRIDSTLKFVFILDEYDRINEEFFLPGNIGETLSSSIGKSLNSSRNIGFILVGSENMHLLDRQGINYNSFHEKEVDTFDKIKEYSSFKKIVTGPTSLYLHFSDRAIERIYEESNGNPYFANLICANAFNNAYKNQDSHINHHAINQAIDTIVNSSQRSHFEHFWGDGITEESTAKRERKTDIRRRIFVSYSMAFQKNSSNYPTHADLIRNFKFPEEYKVENYEVENTTVEFFNRKIFFENDKNKIRIQPLLFENWLCGPGKTLMIQGVSDLEALHREKELEEQYKLKNEELERMSEALIYQGQRILPETFLKYFNQFGNPLEQRKVFNLLDRIFYISQEEINEFIRKEQKNIFIQKHLEIKSSVHTLKREGVELYSFSKNICENEVLAESFKRMSRIRLNKSVKNIKTEINAWKKGDISEIIIIEPIVEDISVFSEELSTFLTIDKINHKVSVRLVIFVITSKAKMNLIKFLSSYSNVKLFIMKEVEDKVIQPFIEATQLFENNEESNQSFAIVRKFFPLVKRNCLLVLFESICPSKSLPILWCKTPQFTPIFPNVHIDLNQQNDDEEKEKLRTRMYHANTILSQKLNAFIVNNLKEKARNEKKEDWFRVDYIPKIVLTTVLGVWIQEGQESPKESYFNFLDYKRIIELNKELQAVFSLPGEGLAWCDKLNVLRRDPAHPEKPAPSLEEVEYFEKIKNKILSKLTV